MPDAAVPTPPAPRPPRVAIVTGANHGIGAATAVALAAQGVDVLLAYLRLDEPPDDPGPPDAYHHQRRRAADDVLAAIEPLQGRAVAVEADLLDDGAAGHLFDAAERRLGPVSDPGQQRQRLGRRLVRARSGRSPRPPDGPRDAGDDRPQPRRRRPRRRPADRRARPAPRRPRGGMGSHRRSHLGRAGGLPERGLLRGGQGGPGELHAVRGHRAGPLRHHGQRRPPARHRHRLGHRRGAGVRRRLAGSPPHRQPGRGRRDHRLAVLGRRARWSPGCTLRLR